MTFLNKVMSNEFIFVNLLPSSHEFSWSASEVLIVGSIGDSNLVQSTHSAQFDRPYHGILLDTDITQHFQILWLGVKENQVVVTSPLCIL